MLLLSALLVAQTSGFLRFAPVSQVTITATSIDAVKVCKKLVETTVSDEPQAGDQNRSIDCPPGIVGRIIGRGGETIR